MMTNIMLVNYHSKDCGHIFDSHKLMSSGSTKLPDKNWGFSKLREACDLSNSEKSNLDSDIPF